MSDRSRNQRMRVLRDDADQARVNLESAVAQYVSDDDRERAIRIGDSYAKLALADSLRMLSTSIDDATVDVLREWGIFRAARQQAQQQNGHGPDRESRKV